MQEQARKLAKRAVELAPNLAEAHRTLGDVLDGGLLEFSAGFVEYERAMALAPGDARMLSSSAFALVRMGRIQDAITRAQRAVALDPLSADAHETLAEVQLFSHRERDAILEFNRALSLNPTQLVASGLKGFAYMWLGDATAALQACETPPPSFVSRTCLTIVHHKLNQLPEAQRELEFLQKNNGDSMSYQYAEIYAQWGESETALRWLGKAYTYRDPGLSWMPMDRFIDPLRSDPRYQNIERKLNYPK